MAITNFVKRIQDVMRNDAGVNGDAQRIEQIVWTLFLKIYDLVSENRMAEARSLSMMIIFLSFPMSTSGETGR